MEKEYGIIKAKSEHPVRDLLRVPHKDGALIVSHPAFGPNYFNANIEEMQKSYSHPVTGERISFREPTTSESISGASYDFENMAKLSIFDPRWLQTGRIVRTSKGVFVNPPRDEKGNLIIDEQRLEAYILREVNGIYRADSSDLGFAPYNSFTQGVQDCNTFAEGGLARALEHTEGKTAENLRKIASPKNYKRGVNVFGFDKVTDPVLRVAGLDSGRDFDDYRLYVYGDVWTDGNYSVAFGVLE